MRPFDQVEYPLDPLSHRRASADPLAMVGASRSVVATGSFHRHRSVLITHKENRRWARGLHGDGEGAGWTEGGRPSSA